MKIYTRTGDSGETSLFAGGRVAKDDARLHAYGTVDELNAILGLVLASNMHPDLAETMRRIQRELFTVGSDLATPLDASPEWIHRLDGKFTERLERDIDQFEAELPPLKNFILPGGTQAAAFLHQARTVCRRAERWAVTIKEEINPHVLTYLNRLSDWLFVLARVENVRAGVEETIWISH
ncbi:MAG: cob(I)yrinic acid a,c-diamide adenosyltransferase [Anaerolineae bacterium]|jgi:cob(I)alamin adenosyltransferase|nr:MAG: cob(I)yrinic acid a,c-diamide adenosyltransferase [Anaerolineae bacterium]